MDDDIDSEDDYFRLIFAAVPHQKNGIVQLSTFTGIVLVFVFCRLIDAMMQYESRRIVEERRCGRKRSRAGILRWVTLMFG